MNDEAMKEQRLIATSILKDYSISDLPVAVRELGMRLLLIADDYGLFQADARFIANEAAGFVDDLTPENIPGYLDVLEEAGCLARYDAEGMTYGILKWNANLSQSKPSCPMPEGYSAKVFKDSKGKPRWKTNISHGEAFKMVWEKSRRQGHVSQPAPMESNGVQWSPMESTPNKGMNEEMNSFIGGLDAAATAPPASAPAPAKRKTIEERQAELLDRMNYTSTSTPTGTN